jgi:hypothetical protein
VRDCCDSITRLCRNGAFVCCMLSLSSESFQDDVGDGIEPYAGLNTPLSQASLLPHNNPPPPKPHPHPHAPCAPHHLQSVFNPVI